MNAYPNDNNYPVVSFDQPVQSPDIDPDAGDLIYAGFNEAWAQVLCASVDQLRLPSTWEGTDDEKRLATMRANTLKMLLANASVPSVPAPYWEGSSSADDVEPRNEQTWYGYVSEGNFIEDAGVFLISNFLAATLTEKAAILYATHQRRVRLEFIKSGLPAFVNIFVQDALAVVVDLFGTEGEIVEVDVLTGYVDDAVEILQVLDSV